MTDGPRCDTITRMSLLRGLFWVALFAFFAFCFVVLFEYGTADFANGFKTEALKVKTYVMEFNQPPKKIDPEKK